LKATAAVIHRPDDMFSLETIELDDLRNNEILVRIEACGICHTDVKARNILSLPAVLGHEGTGIVETIGSTVTRVKPGDRVVISYPWCGDCPQCVAGNPFICTQVMPICFGGSRLDGSSTMTLNNAPISGAFFQQSSFASHAITLEQDVVKVNSDLPPEMLSALPCGVQTGAGAILNTLSVGAKDSLLVIGAGTVGLSAVMAGKLAGAFPLIVVDLNKERLELAKELGASHIIHDNDNDLAKQVRDITTYGVTSALDTSGSMAVLEMAIECLAQGGRIGIVTAPPGDHKFPFNTRSLFSRGASLHSVFQGSAIPNEFIPRLLKLNKQGRFPYDRLIKTYQFADINTAFEDAKSGCVIKPVLIM
jgi:aryl-alcohol dehydrogenase